MTQGDRPARARLGAGSLLRAWLPAVLVAVLVLAAGVRAGAAWWPDDRRAAPVATHRLPPSTRPAPPPVLASGIDVPVIGTHPAHLTDLQAGLGSPPVWVHIGGIDVAAPVVPVGIDGSGELAVPPGASTVSWYRAGPTPGHPGSAVLAGHVDYDGVEGRLFRLGEVGLGTTVTVAYGDGTQRDFRVVDRRQFAKPDLPSADLFATSGPSRLVLITCGGSFDRDARSYADNVVVYAEPV